MANKPIPLSAANARRAKSRSYQSPTKPESEEGKNGGSGLQVETKIPAAPKHGNRTNVLGREGMREWRRITRLLQNAKVVAEVDRAVLTQYCLLWEDMLTDRENFNAAKHTQLRLCAIELGLTPSARARFRG